MTAPAAVRAHTRARRCRGALSAAIAAAAAGGAFAVAGSHAAPPAATPVLVHDVAASRDRLPSYNPDAAEADYEQPDTQIEPSAAVNPANPLNVVIAYQEGRIDSGGDATNGYATSFDGGATWTSGELPGLTNVLGQGGPFDRASDAVVAFGPDNVVYANSLVFDTSGQGLRSGIAVNVSHDGGRTWSAPVFLQDDLLGGTNDKNWVVVDMSDAPGHHKGRVYVVWDRIAPVVDAYCDSGCDQLANWTGFQKLPGIVFPAQGLGAYPLVLPDGSLGIVITSLIGGVPQAPGPAGEPDIQSAGSNEIVFIKAPLAGTTPWPAPLAFLPPIDIAAYRSNGVAAQRAGGLPSAAVDPATGQIYSVWEDDRFRTDGNNDVVLSSSTDGGMTWPPPTRVSAGPTSDNVDHYNPSVAVGAGGSVHIAYRQRAETGDAPLYQPYIHSYYQESTDSGQTFTAPLRIDRQPSHAWYAAFSRAGTFEGDYDQIASAGGYTYFVRCQASPAHPGEPPALTVAPPSPPLPVQIPLVTSPNSPSLQLADSGRGHQHQWAWVALVRDASVAVAASSAGSGSSASAPPPASPSAAGGSGVQGLGLVNTSAAGSAVGIGGAAAVAVLLAVAGARRRRRR